MNHRMEQRMTYGAGKKLVLGLLSCTLLACSSGYLKYEGEKDIFKNEDFEQKVKIEPGPAMPEANPPVSAGPAEKPQEQISKVPDVKIPVPPAPKMTKIPKSKKVPAKSKVPVVTAPTTRQPELEDNEGFIGTSRRPAADPFRVGESVVHSVSYFSTEAGRLTFSVRPFVEVNGKKSYNFSTVLKTSRLFSSFYSVEDQVETFVDFEDLTPHVFKLHIKETGQLREGRSYFDHVNLKANYWEHKYTEKSGHEEKKYEWDILPFSQNAFTGIFYMRIFKWEVGKEYSFRVADDQKNIIFKGKALKKERIKTDAGEFNAIQIKAEIVSRGALEQAGDLYFWISDDDRKYVLRIEAKIKIGTLISEVVEIIPGSK